MIQFPPKKILVPVFLADTAMTAWEQAGDLARAFGAQREAIYVEDWGFPELAVVTTDPSPPALRREGMVRILHERLGQGTALHVVEGFAAQTIVSWASKRDFDLMVIGTHGRAGISRALMGSAAEAIVRQSTIPVLVTHVRIRQWDRVVAPVSEKPYALEALAAAATVASRANLPLRVLHVVMARGCGDKCGLKWAKGYLDALISRLPAKLRHACHITPDLAFGDVPTRIVSSAGPRGLIVVASHERHFLREWFVGTTAERILRHASKSVLAVPVLAGSSPVCAARRTSRPAHKLVDDSGANDESDSA